MGVSDFGHLYMKGLLDYQCFMFLARFLLYEKQKQ